MKKYVMLMCLTALFWLVGCTQTAEPPVATPEPQVETEATESSWQQYEDIEGGFTLQYPPHWQMEDLPDSNEGLLREMVFQGAEGQVTIHWGVGLGGACPEGYKDFVLSSGETLQMCFSPQENGTSYWSLSGQLSDENGFSAMASTSDSEASSQELVEKILSTITFTQK